MIDSVLKGTGNSRFLKSAVPAGTSWADALAMLQAGTFPIDFNGINTEGFQQVGTPLNKANLLKDATAAQIDLPPSTTPDGMFQALGNTGELHVWRKTVTTAQEIPAGYTLGIGEKTTLIIKSLYGSGTQYANVEYGNACAVYDNGEAYIPNSKTTSNFIVTDSSTLATLNDTLKGKFCKFHAVSGSNRLTVSDGVFFIPSNATFQNEIPTSGDTKITVDVAQKVNAYPLTPAGTTTTYPVSTNPKAYQEGDDAKEAGYTLGEVVSGKFRVSLSYVQGTAYWSYGTSLTVSDDGTVNIANPSSVSLSGSSSSVASAAQQMAGKYAVCTFVSDPGYEPDFSIGTVVFFPSDTLFTRLDSSYWASKYQPVTGYAAIPAGTTIEYLGKLGDKARVQVVSYVGTGTYGADNPCSLTFDFPPKVVMFLRGYKKGSNQFGFLTASHNTDNKVVTPESLTTTYTRYNGFGGNFGSYAKKSEDGKTIFWYNEDTSTQGNNSGYTYYFLALG